MTNYCDGSENFLAFIDRSTFLAFISIRVTKVVADHGSEFSG